MTCPKCNRICSRIKYPASNVDVTVVSCVMCGLYSVIGASDWIHRPGCEEDQAATDAFWAALNALANSVHEQRITKLETWHDRPPLL